MKETNEFKKEFFASANGYSGFRSYFDEIFDSRKFERIFVLKGGPGSGKSTLMKKAAKAFCDGSVDIELFRCSSDKSSLDAIIMRKENKQVAIIDGTAPHERDAVIPGAVDVIVNLGDAFDNKALSNAKKEVLKLNLCKKTAYQKAYENLYKSSVFAKNIEAEIKESFDFSAAKKCARELVRSLNVKKNNTADIRLFTSFSKDGYTKISGFQKEAHNVYTIVGRLGSDTFFMKEIENILLKEGFNFVRMPSAFDDDVTEGLYFSESGIAIVCSSGGEEICDSERFIKDIPLSSIEKIKALQQCRSIYETSAKEELIKASEYHFALEKIYTAAVDFSIIDRYTEKIIEQISATLS